MTDALASQHVSAVGELLVFVAYTAPSPVAFAELAHRLRNADREARRVPLMVVTRPAAGIFSDPDLRGLFQAALAQGEAALVATAAVVTGTGFATALAHSGAATMSLQRTLPCPLSLFGDLELAAEWLHAKAPVFDIDAAVEHAESRFRTLREPMRIAAS